MILLYVATWMILPGHWWSIRRARVAVRAVRSAPWPIDGEVVS